MQVETESQFETNGLKGMYFQGVKTRALSLSARGVKLMSTCTAPYHDVGVRSIQSIRAARAEQRRDDDEERDSRDHVYDRADGCFSKGRVCCRSL